MKRTWLVWVLVGGVIVTVLIAFNYERGKETVPLSEVFPDSAISSSEVEYEFFDTDEKGSAQVTAPLGKEAISVVPAVESVKTVAATKKDVSTSAATATTSSAGSSVSSITASVPAVKVFTIQVAAFKDKSKAEKALEQAQRKGYSAAYIDTRTRKDGSVWHQICIGKFDAQSSAKELLTKVKQDYKDGYIKVLTGK